VEVWDTETKHQVLKFEGLSTAVTCLKFSPDTKWLIVGAGLGRLHVFSTGDWKEKKFVQEIGVVRVVDIVFSPYSDSIAASFASNEERFSRIAIHGLPYGEIEAVLGGKNFNARQMTYLDDGKALLSIGTTYNGHIPTTRLTHWRTSDWQKTAELPFDGPGLGMALSPDQRYIALSGTKTRVIDVKTGKVVATNQRVTGQSIAWVPDGKSIYFISEGLLWQWHLDDPIDLVRAKEEAVKTANEAAKNKPPKPKLDLTNEKHRTN